ncbi:MAG: ethylbenzene dehydrogenase [Candidatus Latescibacteria bacterium]|nr:ethylbenzene dehydrogenase [Candidatus Latescibacterota bacterium]
MRSKYSLLAILLLAGLAALVGTTSNLVSANTQQSNELTSQYVTTPPVLDGTADAVWDEAQALSFPVVGGANAGSHQVTLKSVYSGDQVYFLVSWNDPTESLRRFPWVKQEDGTWKRLVDGPSGDDNVFYEDKMAFIWNIDNSITGFNQAGCFATCHAGEAGKPYGNKYTANPGEMGDIWHWKSVRTGSVNQIDDQYVDDMRYSSDTPEAGRHSDPKTSGGYTDNYNADKTAPGFMDPNGANAGYWILDSEKKEFVDTFKAGDEIAGIVVAPLAGDRGDLPAMAQYSNGAWTMELSRKLVTGSDKDVQFSDLSQAYYFGVAVFDNAQVRHSFETGASALKFSQRPTAVAQSSWGEVKQLVSK